MLLTQARITESTWTVPLVSLLLVGMLAAFYAVVSNATRAGELRRQAMAAQAAAVKRCNALPNWDASRHCVKRQDAGVVADETVLLAAK